MWKRIKTLCLLQMSDKYKFKKIENKKMLVASILLRVLGVGIITGVCAALTMLLVDVMFIPRSVNLLTFIILLFQVLSIISCTNGLMNKLYTSKDNMILLSYPAKHVEVFASKLIVFYIYEFIKNLYFLTPFFLGFGIIVGIVDFWYIIAVLLFTIILPAFPVLIGALLSVAIVYFKKLLNAIPALKVILIVGLMIGSFVVLYNIVQLIPVPLQLLAIYGLVIDALKEFIAAVTSFGLFYNNIGSIFFGQQVLLNYLIVLVVLIGLTGLVVAILMPLFFKLACSTSEHSNDKKHKQENKAHKNTFLTFVRKEWVLSIRNFGEFVSNYIFMFATPYVVYIMASIFSSVDRNLLGEKMTVIFIGFIALLMASASNTSSAMAISSEGSEFSLLKTAPGKTSNIAWAKILFNFVFSTIMLFISFLLIVLFCKRLNDIYQIWLMFASVVFVNGGLILWSFEMDIVNPNLREVASTGTTSNLKNFSHSIMIGFIVSLLFAILGLIFLLDDGDMMFVWVRIVGMSIIFFLCRLYLFRSNLHVYFKEIEF